MAQEQAPDKTYCVVSNTWFRNGRPVHRVTSNMKIEIWSDVACPWCYIGKVSQMFEHVTEQARGEGLNYRFDSVVVANSFTAHRLIHLAAAHGKQDEAKERLLSDHFEHGKDVGSRAYLTSLALDLGIDKDEAEELFTTDRYTDDVRLDFEEGRSLGINGVPFFVIDRKFGLSGAQPAETFTAALNQAWQAANPWCWSTPPTATPAARTAAGSSGAFRRSAPVY